MAVNVYPAGPERWRDLELLFGPRGACAGCWCMWWRLRKADFEHQKGEGNRQALRQLVECGNPPGLIAYSDGVPVGWCAVGPRAQLPRMEASRILKAVDAQPVWSVSCFFVARAFRRKGISADLLQAAADYARSQGAAILEGYPVDPGTGLPDAFVWTGLAGAFVRVGFREVARRSPSRPIMRLQL